MTIVLLAAVLIGIVTGLRAMMGPAIVSWAAQLGSIDVAATPLAFIGWRWTPWLFTLVALGELVTDQLPSTPSRTVPPQFIVRLVLGALAGATIGAGSGQMIAGGAAGAIGALIGTLGGAKARGALASAFGNDRPAAIVEDIVALAGGIAIVNILG